MLQANESLSTPFTWLKTLWRGRPKDVSCERRGAFRKEVSIQAEIQAPGGAILVNCVDFHRYGAKVVSKLGWATGTALFIRLRQYRLMGFAYVCHCTLQEDLTYAIGLEFRAPLMRQEAGEWQFERICQSEGAGTEIQETVTGMGSPRIQ